MILPGEPDCFPPAHAACETGARTHAPRRLLHSLFRPCASPREILRVQTHHTSAGSVFPVLVIKTRLFPLSIWMRCMKAESVAGFLSVTEYLISDIMPA